MSDLKDRLQTIDGIGPATADDILAVIEDTDTDSEPQGYMAKAIHAAEQGDYRQAGIYLSRTQEE